MNHVVHKGQTQGQWKRGQKEVEAEEKAAENSGVLGDEDLVEGNLYVVKLDTPDGEFSLGLVRLGAVADEDTRSVYWFARASRGHAWPSRVKFERYMNGETWISAVKVSSAPSVHRPRKTYARGLSWLRAIASRKQAYSPMLRSG